jgi:glycerophosphoryl diester phosphodiesterase
MAEAKSLGLKVIPWTVNERADMARLIALGVDGLITDYPDRLRALMAEKDMPLPPAVR